MILLSILPRFWPLLELLFVFMNFFAIGGLAWFKEGWSGLPEDSIPQGSYVDLLEAYLILFELLVGNNWSDTMGSTVLKYGEYAFWYYLLYVIICTTLFTNLFMGVLLDAFTRFLEEEGQEMQRSQKALLKGAEPDQVHTSQPTAAFIHIN